VQKGLIWSFTTANFLIVDDFESYNDLDPDDPNSNRIFNVWLDGFDDPSNGSVVGYADIPFTEQKIVHGGSQSMPLAYDNAVGNSEATMTLTYPRDWAVNNIGILTIWFRGDPANAAELMYVALNGSAGVSNDNAAAAQISTWTQWDIDLQAFADQGVNLANVNTISLGFGDKSNPQAGGSGMVFFDDIRLCCPPAAGLVLKLDVGNSHNAEELEGGFTSFTLADSGSDVDGITIEFGGINSDDSRRRGEPSGVPYENIYRDFIFGRQSEPGVGLVTVTLSGLQEDQTYQITLYSWDVSSTNTRIADWTANGESLFSTIHDGNVDPPAAVDDYAYTAAATADANGVILMEAVPGEGTFAAEPFAFINALVLVPTEPETP